MDAQSDVDRRSASLGERLLPSLLAEIEACIVIIALKRMVSIPLLSI